MALSQADKIWVLKETGLSEGAPEDLMLEGTFNTLFDDANVKFNILDGTFNIRNVERGSIIVKGEGERKFWTEKALIRAGYAIGGQQSAIEVEVPALPDSNWICRTPWSINEFNSIYGLVSWIREKRFTF
jgi:iron complex transport system ATP-binding protein